MAGKSDFRYEKLTEILINLIKDGTYKEGSRLPSERELCRQYGVSRTTVRQALQELSNSGYIKSIQGKGTFVSSPPIRQELLTIYSFDEDMRRLGKTPKTEVLDFVVIAATAKMAELFQISADAPVYRISRLRSADGEPMLMETNYLPAYRFEGLNEEMIQGKSLYGIMLEKYKLTLTHAEETFSPVLLRTMEAKLLDTQPNALGMMVERISYENSRAVEYSKSLSPGDKFKYHVILRNKQNTEHK
ncbi:MAG TPA: GntR family transcriptional regulator [Clostridiales bacterium]|nr:GntR family transcriptional regulator [Clostridiales bacterium]